MEFIGKITGIHGLKGEITFSHQLKKNTRFNTWDCLMIELNPQSFIPFFITSIKVTTETECICKLEEINDREEAKLVLNKNIYSSIHYNVENVRVSNLQQYIGYLIVDDSEQIGKIVDAIESGLNHMFMVDYHGKDILIPSQNDLIKSIDNTKKEIHMKLPDGILDL